MRHSPQPKEAAAVVQTNCSIVLFSATAAASCTANRSLCTCSATPVNWTKVNLLGKTTTLDTLPCPPAPRVDLAGSCPACDCYCLPLLLLLAVSQHSQLQACRRAGASSPCGLSCCGVAVDRWCLLHKPVCTRCCGRLQLHLCSIPAEKQARERSSRPRHSCKQRCTKSVPVNCVRKVSV